MARIKRSLNNSTKVRWPNAPSARGRSYETSICHCSTVSTRFNRWRCQRSPFLARITNITILHRLRFAHSLEMSTNHPDPLPPFLSGAINHPEKSQQRNQWTGKCDWIVRKLAPDLLLLKRIHKEWAIIVDGIVSGKQLVVVNQLKWRKIIIISYVLTGLRKWWLQGGRVASFCVRTFQTWSCALMMSQVFCSFDWRQLITNLIQSVARIGLWSALKYAASIGRLFAHDIVACCQLT